MKREELVKNAKAAHEKSKVEYQALTEKIKSVLDGVIQTTGLDGIAKVRRVTDSCAEIEVERPGKSWGHDFNIYFHDRYDGTNYRKVEMNVGTFGSFSASDKPEVNFYVAAGKFAFWLDEIQHRIDSIDFKPYVDACHASYNAADALRRFDNEAKKLEDMKRQSEIEMKLIPGAKIKIGIDWCGKDKIDEIVKVTPKRVYFSNYVNCLSKGEVIRNFMRSSKAWTFAA